jgi:prephenate dehydrogenase
MKVFIVGLGLMGASYAQKLTQMGYVVFGIDKNYNINLKALNEGVIRGFDLKDLKTADVVVLAMYPHQIIDFVASNLNYFDTQLITDISGTKTNMLKQVLSILPKSIHYVSHHPMAGREKSGYDHKDPKMFNNANFLIIDSNHAKKEHIEIIQRLGKDLGFKRQVILSEQAHDDLIAHTSQLTHLLAVGLMLMNDSDLTKDATGDSFRDLTRIANINEVMWTELFLENKHALIHKIEQFVDVLNDLKKDIIDTNEKALKEKLKTSKQRRISFDETNTI